MSLADILLSVFLAPVTAETNVLLSKTLAFVFLSVGKCILYYCFFNEFTHNNFMCKYSDIYFNLVLRNTDHIKNIYIGRNVTVGVYFFELN